MKVAFLRRKGLTTVLDLTLFFNYFVRTCFYDVSEKEIKRRPQKRFKSNPLLHASRTVLYESSTRHPGQYFQKKVRSPGVSAKASSEDGIVG